MGLVEDLRGRTVYLDTNVFIYAVKAVAEYAAAIDALFGLIEGGDAAAYTSELTLAEALAKPFETGRDEIAWDRPPTPAGRLTIPAAGPWRELLAAGTAG